MARVEGEGRFKSHEGETPFEIVMNIEFISLIFNFYFPYSGQGTWCSITLEWLLKVEAIEILFEKFDILNLTMTRKMITMFF